MCHVLSVMCNVSRDTCNVSRFKKRKRKKKIVELVGRGSVINEAYTVYFLHAPLSSFPPVSVSSPTFLCLGDSFTLLLSLDSVYNVKQECQFHTPCGKFIHLKQLRRHKKKCKVRAKQGKQGKAIGAELLE